MFAKVISAGLRGLDGFVLEVEADIQNGIPSLSLTGALSPETREAQFRILNALRNSGIELRPKKMTVNFSPASVRKEGTHFDLPIAIAILASMEKVKTESLSDTAFIGELGLDGSLKFVRGILPLTLTLKKHGIRRVVVPKDNASEAGLIDELGVYGAASLSELIDTLNDEGRGGSAWTYTDSFDILRAAPPDVYDTDFAEVHGQEYLKRAAEIAVSGRHNILFSGPAGTGKTMIAKRIPTIMPPLSHEENLEISMIYSISGLLPEGKPLLSRRPLRCPHHSVSAAAFAGGGSSIMPGEISLASGGILFLDELTLFPSSVLEIMRQPLEEGRITITRVKGNYTYPADFMLVAAMNNCACGYFPDRSRCTCTPAQIRAYTGRLSKPLMERIDIMAEARPIGFEKFLADDTSESSAEIRKRVERVYDIQKERFRDTPSVRFNSRMGVKEIERFCELGPDEERFMKNIFKTRGLSGRAYHKILKVARTIADMEGSRNIRPEHLIEAADLRNTAEKIFENRI